MSQKTTPPNRQDRKHHVDFQHRPCTYSSALWTKRELVDYYRKMGGRRWRLDSQSQLMKSRCVDETIDCTEPFCSLPTVRGRRVMRVLAPGQVLELIASDEGVVCDVLHWVQVDGHELLQSQQREDGVFCFRIRKSGA